RRWRHGRSRRMMAARDRQERQYEGSFQHVFQDMDWMSTRMVGSSMFVASIILAGSVATQSCPADLRRAAIWWVWPARDIESTAITKENAHGTYRSIRQDAARSRVRSKRTLKRLDPLWRGVHRDHRVGGPARVPMSRCLRGPRLNPCPPAGRHTKSVFQRRPSNANADPGEDSERTVQYRSPKRQCGSDDGAHSLGNEA